MPVKHLAQWLVSRECYINVMVVEVVVVKEIGYTASFLPMESSMEANYMNLIGSSGWVGTDLTLLGTATEYWCSNVTAPIV